MRMKRIRDYYRVPAKRGMRVIVDGEPGVITGTTSGSMYIRVRFDDNPKFTVPCHPTWEVQYLNGESNV